MTRRSATERYETILSRADGRYAILLVEGISDYAIYLLTPGGTITSWNRGAELFKGYKAEESIGRPFSEFYTAEDRAAGLPAHAVEVAAREASSRKAKDGGFAKMEAASGRMSSLIRSPRVER